MGKLRDPVYNVPMNIFLYGEGGLGKTKTLKKLYYLLSKVQMPASTRECIIYNYMGRDVKIVICTAGDNREEIEKNLSFLRGLLEQEVKVDIFISAVRQSMDAYNAMQNYEAVIMERYVKSSFTMWVEKLNPKVLESNYKDEKDPASQKTSIADANRLKKIIDFYIDNKLI